MIQYYNTIDFVIEFLTDYSKMDFSILDLKNLR